MASLALMSKLLVAAPGSARVLLVGDRDQLASVEAGAVLGDVCGPLRAGGRITLRLSGPVRAAVTPLVGEATVAGADPAGETGVWDGIVHLRRFHRFGPGSPIGAVTRAIQSAETSVEDVLEHLRDAGTLEPTAGGATTDGAVVLVDPDGGRIPAPLLDRMAEGYRPAVEAAVGGAGPREVLDLLEQQRVLCALRRGPQGVEAVNAHLEARLSTEVAGFDPGRPWYVGRPVLVTRNDYGVGLFNGDVGVVVPDPGGRGRPVVAFPTADGGSRLLAPSRLPPCETVFATSIHKAQGSQYEAVVVVLPTVPSPILTRELVYTAVTRARRRVTIVATEEILRQALGRPVQRASGLEDRLWTKSVRQ